MDLVLGTAAVAAGLLLHVVPRFGASPLMGLIVMWVLGVLCGIAFTFLVLNLTGPWVHGELTAEDLRRYREKRKWRTIRDIRREVRRERPGVDRH